MSYGEWELRETADWPTRLMHRHDKITNGLDSWEYCGLLEGRWVCCYCEALVPQDIVDMVLLAGAQPIARKEDGGAWL